MPLTQKLVIILDNMRFHRMGILQVMANKQEYDILPLALIPLNSILLRVFGQILRNICVLSCLG